MRPPAIVAAAAQVLSKNLGREVLLDHGECLSDAERRNQILRVRDLSEADPASFIIKKVVSDAFDPENLESWDSRRFFSDWAGAEFLSGVLPSRRSPRFYGGHSRLGFFILEDLGAHRSLVEPLLEEDAAGAERALISFAACLGAIHAGTCGRVAALEDVFRGIHPGFENFSRALSGFPERVTSMYAALDALGVRAETGLNRELETVGAAIENPGPFLSYIHGDPCPDNVFWDGNELRLIDFEFGGFGHALADAAYGRMIFPSCWCANALPDALVQRMETVYRSTLARGCPEAQDDRTFEGALVAVCGFWLVSTLSRQLANAIEADRTWGIATIRQRVLRRLEAFIATDHELNRLPALRGTSERLLERLRETWQGLQPLPLYPAFSRPSS